MRIATVREFRDRATEMLRGDTPVVVTRRGKLAGVYFPHPQGTFPIEFKRELYSLLSAQVARDLRKRGATEKEVLADFALWRRKRRAGRG